MKVLKIEADYISNRQVMYHFAQVSCGMQVVSDKDQGGYENLPNSSRRRMHMTDKHLSVNIKMKILPCRN